MKVVKNHGTKILGVLGTIVGVAAAADPALLGPKVLPFVLLAQGLLTVLRGFQNSKNATKP